MTATHTRHDRPTNSGEEVRREAQLVRGLLAGAAVATVASAPFLVLLLVVRGGYTPVAELDGRVANALNGWAGSRPDVVHLLELVDRVTSPWTFRVLVALVAAMLWRHNRRRLATWAVVTMAVGGVLGVVLKLLVGRARPVFDEPVSFSSGLSFPSGHALNSMLGTVILLRLLLPLLGRRGHIAAWMIAVFVVGLTAADRVSLGVHFLTDVLAGWALALALAAGTAVAFGTWQRAHPQLVDDPDGAAQRRADEQIRCVLRETGALLRCMLLAAVPVIVVMVGFGLLVTQVLIELAMLGWLRETNTELASRRTDLQNTVTDVFSSLADTPTIILGTAIAMGALRVLFGRWREGVFVMSAVVLQALVFLATQFVVARPRPEVEQLDPAAPTSSFPSGHTSAAIALYGSLALLLLWRRLPEHAARAGAWVPRAAAMALFAIPLLVAWARLYRGLHYPLDIVGSVLQAGLAITIAYRLVLRAHLPESLATLLDAKPPPDPALAREPAEVQR